MINGKQRHDAVDELRRAATGEYRHVDAVTNCTSVIPVKYCPNCSAEVI